MPIKHAKYSLCFLELKTAFYIYYELMRFSSQRKTIIFSNIWVFSWFTISGIVLFRILRKTSPKFSGHIGLFKHKIWTYRSLPEKPHTSSYLLMFSNNCHEVTFSHHEKETTTRQLTPYISVYSEDFFPYQLLFIVMICSKNPPGLWNPLGFNKSIFCSVKKIYILQIGLLTVISTSVETILK